MRTENYQVIYLTGPPATGKSTLVAELEAKVRPLLTLTYSRMLADHISTRGDQVASQDLLRQESARLIRPEDVTAVDEQLLELVREKRSGSHIIIDSHPVTKEAYGYRVTPFSVGQVMELRPTLIFMLYAAAPVIRGRIARDPRGRPPVSAFESDMHTHLQSSVALTYGIHLGVPVYFLDSSASAEELSETVMKRLQ